MVAVLRQGAPDGRSRAMPQLAAKVCPGCGARYDAEAEFCQLDGKRLEDNDPYIGRTLLDQFVIEEALGAGGMGTVYRARQTTVERDVAIKILHPELATDPDAVRRFQREARVSSELEHPNIVRVYLFGQLPGEDSLYLVMQYLDGRPLSDVVRNEGALSLRRALHIVTQICDGIGDAHLHGVVHRTSSLRTSFSSTALAIPISLRCSTSESPAFSKESRRWRRSPG